MAYSVDFKRLAVRLLDIEKKTQEEVVVNLQINPTTLTRWLKLDREGKLYEVKERVRKGRKVSDKELRAYVEAHPFAGLIEIGEAVGLSRSGTHDALKRLGISYKKNALLQRA